MLRSHISPTPLKLPANTLQQVHLSPPRQPPWPSPPPPPPCLPPLQQAPNHLPNRHPHPTLPLHSPQLQPTPAPGDPRARSKPLHPFLLPSNMGSHGLRCRLLDRHANPPQTHPRPMQHHLLRLLPPISCSSCRKSPSCPCQHHYRPPPCLLGKIHNPILEILHQPFTPCSKPVPSKTPPHPETER